MTERQQDPTRTADLDAAASAWQNLDDEISEAEDRLAQEALPLEIAARSRLDVERRFSRTGQCPFFRGRDAAGRYCFHVTNGMDNGDDFDVSFTLAELQADQEEYRREFERAEYESKLKGLRDARANIDRRLQELLDNGQPE